MDKLISNIVGGSNQLPNAKKVDDEISLNLYVENSVATEASTDKFLRSLDGTKTLFDMTTTATASDCGCRGIAAVNATASGNAEIWGAFGGEFWRFWKDGEDTLAAAMKYPTGFPLYESVVRFADGGGIDSNLVAVCGKPYMYRITSKATVPEVHRVLLPKNPYKVNAAGESQTICPTHVASVGNRVIVNDSGTSQLFISQVGVFSGGADATCWKYVFDANNNIVYEADGYTPKYEQVSVDGTGPDTSNAFSDYYGAAEYQTALSYTGDTIQSFAAINNNKLFVFGRRSFDVWTLNTNDDGYTLANTGMGSNIGIAAVQSLAQINDKLFWLGSGEEGQNGIWLSENAGTPKKISTPGIDRRIAAMSDTEDAIGIAYNFAGHTFYVISFPVADKSLCYDYATGYWHDRADLDLRTGRDTMWSPCFCAAAWGTEIFGAYTQKKLICNELGKYDDYRGVNIRRMRRSPVYLADYSPIRIDELKVVANSGSTAILQPTTDGHETEGYNPTMMLAVSYDGTKYQAVDVARLGKAGHYSAECRYQNLGAGRYFVLELSITDKVCVTLSDAKIRYSQLGRF